MIRMEGVGDLVLDLNQLAEIPGGVIEAMLNAGGDVVAAAQKQEITALGLVDSGKMRDAITVNRDVKKRDNTYYITVYPKGIHHTYTDKEGTKVNVSNGDVIFIQHYGAPRRNIPATQVVDKANGKSADGVTEAAAKVYDEYLKKLNL